MRSTQSTNPLKNTNNGIRVQKLINPIIAAEYDLPNSELTNDRTAMFSIDNPGSIESFDRTSKS